jgi:hypothetical protein
MAEETEGGIRYLMNIRMAEALQKALIDDLPEDDDTRCDSVSIRAPDLKARRRLVVTLRNFDPMVDNRTVDDTKANRGDVSTVFKDWPDAIIGGQTTEIIRGTVMVEANFTSTREEKAAADKIVSKVISRIKQALRRVSMAGLKDEFGEMVLAFRVVEGSQYDSGNNTSNTSVDFVRWAALTLTARQGV